MENLPICSALLLGALSAPRLLAALADKCFDAGANAAGRALMWFREWFRGLAVAIGWRRFYGAYDLEGCFAKSDEVWLAWLAGRTELQQSDSPVVKHRTKITRVIFPDPKHRSVEILAELEGPGVSNEVQRGIEKAQEAVGSASVKVYPGFWGIETTIGFYKRRKRFWLFGPLEDQHRRGWVHCCVHLPGLSYNERVFYRVTSKALFQAHVKAFRGMWKNATQSTGGSVTLPSR